MAGFYGQPEKIRNDCINLLTNLKLFFITMMDRVLPHEATPSPYPSVTNYNALSIRYCKTLLKESKDGKEDPFCSFLRDLLTTE